MKRFAWIALLLAGVTVLAACGMGSGNQTTGEKTGKTSVPAKASETAKMSETAAEQEPTQSAEDLLEYAVENGEAAVSRMKDQYFRGELTLPEKTPDGVPVTAIKQYVFSGCHNLEKVNLPSTLVKIESNAFLNCPMLKEIVIPDSVTDLGSNVFEKCSSLEKVTLSSALTFLSGNSFKGCTSLRTIVVKDGVTNLFNNVFEDCTALTTVDLPASLKSVFSYAFSGCTSLAEINFGGTAEQWNEVYKAKKWNEGCGAIAIHCSDGDAAL